MANPLIQRVLNEGMTHHQAGRPAEAAVCYAKVAAVDPFNYEAHQYGGMAALLLGRLGEARTLFSKALKLRPKAAASAVALGLTELALGEADSAERSLQLAVSIDPRNGEAWDNLGLILKSKGRIDQALDCHVRAVKVSPRSVMAWINHGSTLLATPRVEEALACFERALRLEPTSEAALGGKAICLYRSHLTQEAADLLGRVVARNPRNLQLFSQRLLALNNLTSISSVDLWREHQAFGISAGAPVRQLSPRRLAQGESLRVGILSCDLKGHSVTYFLKPLLRAASSHGISLHLYHDHGIEDQVSAELRALCDQWANVAGSMDDTVERRLLADRLDVLVDLAGHTGSNRLGMLAHRVAPVQVTFLGYPNTTGVQAMDYRFVDPITDPEGHADQFHSERLVRFSPCAWSYEAPPDAPVPRDSMRASGEAPVFGCFNHATKITDVQLGLWAQILTRLPKARLVLKSPGLEQPFVREPFLRRLKVAGIDQGRTTLLGTTPDVTSHLALYTGVDIALDTAPYGGTTTTCEALWMGVPVVTLVGDRHASRVGLSLLTAIGCEGWAALSPEAYVNIAVSLAADPEVTRGSELRERMRHSMLCDGTAQAGRFWSAVRACSGTES